MRILSNILKGTAKDLAERTVTMRYPRGVEMVTVVSDYLNMALSRKDQWWSHADLQMHLAISLSGELRFLQEIGKLEPNGDEEQKTIHFLKQITRATANALTQVADGIAFRFLNYDLGICSILGGNDTSPFAVHQEGFLNVMDWATIALDSAPNDAQMLVCDLNSVTNEGDFILKRGDEFEVVEVKKGVNTRGARLNRQLQRLNDLSDFVNNRQGMLDGKEVRLRDMPSRSHHFVDVEEAFVEAAAKGYCVRQLTDYQSVTCIDPSEITDQSMSDLMHEVGEKNDAIWGAGKTFDLTSMQTREISGSIVPMSVFPLDPKLIADLLMGQRMFISTISFDALFAAISQHGWAVMDLTETDLQNQPWPGPTAALLSVPGQPERNVTFPVKHLTSMAANFIDLGSIISPMKEIVMSDPATRHWISSFPSESGLWR